MLANRKGEKIGPQILAAPAHAGSFRQLAGLAAQPLNARRPAAGLSLAMWEWISRRSAPACAVMVSRAILYG
jgi:hypothetical protein